MSTNDGKEGGVEEEKHATEIILRNYVNYKESHTKDSVFTVNIKDDNLFNWEVNVDIHKLDHESEFYKDAKKYEVNEIIFRIMFPPDYPSNPPYVHVISPRFAPNTGCVTIKGCLDIYLLSKEGWKPTISANELILNILAGLVEPTEGRQEPRIDPSNRTPYSLESEIAAYEKIAK